MKFFSPSSRMVANDTRNPGGGPPTSTQWPKRGLLERGSLRLPAIGLAFGLVLLILAYELPGLDLHSVERALEPELHVAYLAGPLDELTFQHTYPLAGRVEIYETGPREPREVLNFTLDPRDTIAWSIGEHKGFLQILFYQPTSAAVVEQRTAWVGNSSVLIAPDVASLAELATRRLEAAS